MKKLILVSLVTILFSCKMENEKVESTNNIEVSNSKLERVEPLNWWIGLKDNTLQLLVKEDNIGKATVEVCIY